MSLYVPPQIPAITIYAEPKDDGIYLSSNKIIVGKESPYEITKFAIKEDSENLTFVIKANMPFRGLPEFRAIEKHIGFGDLILYGRTKIGIRMKDGAVFSDIKTINDAANHFGNRTSADYLSRLKLAGSTAKENLPPEWVTHLKGGKLIGYATITEREDIEVSVNKDLLPNTFKAYLPLECGNDYVLGQYSIKLANPLLGTTRLPIATTVVYQSHKARLNIYSDPQPIPEPSALFGLGLSLLALKLKRKK